MNRADELKEAVSRPVSFLHTMRAVAWSFFGVRRAADHENDIARLNPLHVIVAGVIGAVLFILALLLLVQWVIGSGVATT